METTARRARYQRRVAGAANDFIGIPAGLVHIDDSQTAEGCDDSDIGVAMIGRKASDRLGSGWPFPTIITSNGTTRRLAVVSRAWNHRQSAFGKIKCHFGKWPRSEIRSGAHLPRLRNLDWATSGSLTGGFWQKFCPGVSGWATTPPFPFSLAGAPETPLLADAKLIPAKLPALAARLRLRPNALRIATACSGVGKSNRRRHPSVSPSWVSLQKDNRRLMADHLRGLRRRRRATSRRSVPRCRRAPGGP